MRKLRRMVAKNKMRKKGYTRIFKKGADKNSYFSQHWREFV